jgi:hypothetical protein
MRDDSVDAGRRVAAEKADDGVDIAPLPQELHSATRTKVVRCKPERRAHDPRTRHGRLPGRCTVVEDRRWIGRDLDRLLFSTERPRSHLARSLIAKTDERMLAEVVRALGFGAVLEIFR